MRRVPESGEALALSRTLDVCPDAVTLYAKLSEGGCRPHTMLLESADVSRSGETSLILSRAALRLSARGRTVDIDALSENGKNLLPHLAARLRETGRVVDDGASLHIHFPDPRGGSEAERLHAPNVLDAARTTILGLRLDDADAPPPLLAGTFAYDLIASYEALPPARHDPLEWPDFELWLCEELVMIHHAARRTSVVRYVYGGAGAEAAYHDAADALRQRVAELAEPLPPTEAPSERQSAAPAAAEPSCDLDDDAFGALVERLKQHIVAGDVFQIVPSRSFELPCPDALAAYRRLRALNPSPYMFFVVGGAGTLFGASPESALKVSGRPRRVTINPIAGTRPRARRPGGAIDGDLDGRLEAELRLDEKELAEHLMLVDLARNDVARVSRPGTRVVECLLDVVRYSHVMHLVSLVSGELRDDLDALHAYVATMNMGTLVGAPKLKAAELLRRYEQGARGPYGGAVGYLRADGVFDSCIVIRSAVVRGGQAAVRAGCGVVFDSDPAAEALETRRKADAVLAALGTR
jgi:anthranilate synthase component 1